MVWSYFIEIMKEIELNSKTLFDLCKTINRCQDSKELLTRLNSQWILTYFSKKYMKFINIHYYHIKSIYTYSIRMIILNQFGPYDGFESPSSCSHRPFLKRRILPAQGRKVGFFFRNYPNRFVSCVYPVYFVFFSPCMFACLGFSSH